MKPFAIVEGLLRLVVLVGFIVRKDLPEHWSNLVSFLAVCNVAWAYVIIFLGLLILLYLSFAEASEDKRKACNDVLKRSTVLVWASRITTAGYVGAFASSGGAWWWAMAACMSVGWVIAIFVRMMIVIAARSELKKIEEEANAAP